ncbi:meprin A subunit beta-like [Leuresthes tenuis]|uniref:meprin A subunit beta-like n=1 Tax=Leuresthes tenuis TaxID=355514 RepID=UPI003B510364
MRHVCSYFSQCGVGAAVVPPPSQGKGYFMHLNTATAEPGECASLESRPGTQCLQFFPHNTGAADDVLSTWVKEYDMANPSGKLKLFKGISGGGGLGSWELHNVNLNMTQKARVVFEGVRGTSPSKAGFSVGEMNLSVTKCPQHIWHIRNITGLLATTPAGGKLYSPCFLSPIGYSFQAVYLNGQSDCPGYMATYFHLTSGPSDHKLKWPCPWQQVTTVLMDQQSDIRQQMNMHCMVTTDPDNKSSDSKWDDPTKVVSKVTMSDGSCYYRCPNFGTSSFITHSRLKSRNFIKGNDAFFLFSLEVVFCPSSDTSYLLVLQRLPCSAVDVDPD